MHINGNLACRTPRMAESKYKKTHRQPFVKFSDTCLKGHSNTQGKPNESIPTHKASRMKAFQHTRQAE